MRKLLIIVCAFSLIGGCCAGTSAQCAKSCKDCDKKNVTKSTNTKMEQGNKKPLSCKLTTPELRKRKEEVIAKLKKQVLERNELGNGYSYKFDGTDEMLDAITAFIKSERQCCEFFDFKIIVGSDSFIQLEISGAKGVKEFMATELGM